MGGPQRGQHLTSQAGRLHRRQRAAREPFLEGGPGHQLHHEARVRIRIDEVMDGHDVRVIEPGRRPRFAQHALTRAVRHLRVRPHGLERDLPLQHRVPRPPHRAHYAASEPFDQLAASVHELFARTHAQQIRDCARSRKAVETARSSTW